jgi:hypothetical protein
MPGRRRSSRTRCLSRELLKSCQVTSVLIVTLFVLAFPLTPGIMSSSNTTKYVNSTNVSDRQEYTEACSTFVGVAPEGGSDNNTDIQCIQKVLDKCQPFDLVVGYVLGSMRISIKGLTNDSANCSLNVEHEIERSQTNMTCMIPHTKISTWTNWNRGDGLDAIEQIIKYCTINRS